MSEKSQLILLSFYNRQMNARMFQAASKLSTSQLQQDNGAFFKSIIGSLNHILIGDIIWMKRFSLQAEYHSLAELEHVAMP